MALSVSAVALTTALTASASSQKRLETVRICGASALDKREGECTKDESKKPLVSSQFNCSARAQGEPGERFEGRFAYRGRVFPAFGTSVSKDRRGIYIFLTAGPNPMPGGRWACQLEIGPERVRKAFESGGPVAPILYVSVCQTSRTVPAGPVRVCRRDGSRTPFPGTQPVTCSAVFAGGKGKLATIEFLREGKEAFSGDFELPLPVTAAGPRINPSPRLQPGRWACRWSLQGRVLATKQFRIS